MIEGATPNTLLRRGFTRDAVKTGTEITIVGYRAKNGANRANGRDLILPDGSRLFMSSPGTGAPGEGEAAEPQEQSVARDKLCADSRRRARARSAVAATGAFLYARNSTPVVPQLATRRRLGSGIAVGREDARAVVPRLHADERHVVADRADAYAGRVRLAVFDFTDEATIAASSRRSRSGSGSARVLEEAGFATGTILVLDGRTKEIVAWINGSRDFADYRAAIDAALADAPPYRPAFSNGGSAGCATGARAARVALARRSRRWRAVLRSRWPRGRVRHRPFGRAPAAAPPRQRAGGPCARADTKDASIGSDPRAAAARATRGA